MKIFTSIKYLFSSLLLLVLSACGDGSNSGFPTADCGDADNLCVQAITITPEKSAVLVAGYQSYQAIATLTDGSEADITERVSWSVDDTSIATIAADGSTVIATGISNGTAIISAQYRGLQSNAHLSVGAITFSITPSVATILTEMQQSYQAFAVFPNGLQQEVTNQVTWQSDDTDIATINVSESGVTATGLTEGLATISASYNGTSIFAQLNVVDSTAETLLIAPATAILPLGTAKQYSAFITTSGGEVIDVTSTVNWQVTDNTIASIDATAWLSAIKEGSTTITADMMHSDNALSATAVLTVNTAELDSVAITPVDGVFPVGKIGVYRANAHYSDGTVIDVTRQTTWQVADTAIGSIVESGIFAGDSVALSPGKTSVSAQFQSLSSSTNVEVTDAKIISLSISPTDVSTPVGTLVTYQAHAIYSDGSKHNVTELGAWSSSAPAVAGISISGTNAGIADALTIGTTDISMNFDGLSQSTSLTVNNAVVQSLQITPQNPSVPVGIEGQFTAKAIYSDKTTADVTHSANWQVDDYTIAAVVPNGALAGYARALSEGANQLTASFAGQTATTPITVTVATLTSISLTPAMAEIPAGTSQQYQLFGLFSDGSNHDLTAFASYQTSDSAAVSIDSNGLAQTNNNSANPVTITASYNGMQATASLVVTAGILDRIEVNPAAQSIPVGHKAILQARAFYSDSSSADITHLATWSIDDGDIASVDNTLVDAGSVFGISEGVVTVTASYQGQTATNTTTVTGAVLESVSISPIEAKVAAGYTQQFTLTAQFSDRTSLDVTKVSDWKSNDAPTASIDNVGLALGHWEGKVIITGTYQGMSADANLEVTNAIITQLQITPQNPKEPVGTQGKFKVTAFYSDGYSSDITRSATWSSSDTNIISIVTSGPGAANATAEKVGTATISATYNGMTADTLATVTDAELVSIVISPASADIAQGMSYQYTADGLFSDNTHKDITDLAHWRTSDTTLATITSTGLAKGEVQGSVSIVADYMGKSADASLNIAAPVIDHLVIVPSTKELPLGTSIYYQAIAFDSTGKDYLVSNNADWRMVDTNIAHVDNTNTNGGLVTPLAVGTSIIEVTFLGVTEQAVVVVTPATITSLTLSPLDASIIDGTNQNYTATAHFSDLTSLEVSKDSSWQSSNLDVATVTAGGTAVSHNFGTTNIQASYQGMTVQTSLTVVEKEIDNLQIIPHVNHIVTNEQVQLKCSIIYVDLSLGDCTSEAVWTTADDSIAHIEPAGGLVTGLKAGTTRAFATYHGVTSKATDGQVTVAEPVLESITVAPANETLAKEQPQTYKATAHYSGGSTKDISAEVTWSATGGVGSINNNARFNGTSTGVGQVTASLDGISGETAVTVSEYVPYFGDIVPDPIELKVGDAIDLQCFETFALISNSSNQIQVEVTDEANWGFNFSSDIATISNAPGSKGHLVATKAGSNSVACRLPQSNGSFLVISAKITITN